MKLNFILPSHLGTTFELATSKKMLVLFFYPRDNTPGCTIENQDFAMLYSKFTELNCEVIGISRDNIKSHCKFAAKYQLPFQLLSDEDETICNLFEVMKNKKMYGKDVRGIERSTFIIDQNQEIIKEWRKVTVANHAKEVLHFVTQVALQH